MNVVGVWPDGAARERARLFAAIGEMTGVVFEPIDSPTGTAGRLGALVVLGPREDGMAQESAALPTIVFNGHPHASRIDPISFSDVAELDGPLRDQTLLGNWAPDQSAYRSDHLVLARVGREPVWCRRPGRRRFDSVSVDLPELGVAEPLRHRLRPGHCLAPLALLQFLRDVFGRDWSSPPTRACIVIDDPNTRRPTYGHVDFLEIAQHAERFDYHVAFAQIPRDLRSFDPATVDLFREHSGRLSLAPHGNDHTRRELTSSAGTPEVDRILAQALRRVARFESMTGVQVSRVMVPPHDRCSDLVRARMTRLGFEAVTLAHPSLPSTVMAGFDPAEVGDSGMPVIVRRKLAYHDELILRAFMDQPLVLYGHQGDLAGGLGSFERAAALVNRMAGSTWCNLGEIARSNYRFRRSGDHLEIRAFARRFHVQVDAGVRAVVVEPLVSGDRVREREHFPNEVGEVSISDSERSVILVEPTEAHTSFDVRLESDEFIDPYVVSIRGPRVSPSLRRWATESRDRSHPLRVRLGRFFARGREVHHGLDPTR